MRDLPWFRFYKEAVDDAKLKLVAYEDRWHFVALLCCKAQGLIDDQSSLGRRKICVKLGLDSRELDEVARRLGEVELIDPKTLQPLAWEARQFRSDLDPTGAERQQKHRAAKAAARDSNALRNGRVTLTDTDTEADTEADKETEKNKYSAEFRQAWANYPDRPGKNKSDAYKAWSARVKAGDAPEYMLAGTLAYRAYCDGTHVEPRYVKQPATFFGPARHFSSSWYVPPENTQARGNSRSEQRATTLAGLTNQGGNFHAANDPNIIDITARAAA